MINLNLPQGEWRTDTEVSSAGISYSVSTGWICKTIQKYKNKRKQKYKSTKGQEYKSTMLIHRWVLRVSTTRRLSSCSKLLLPRSSWSYVTHPRFVFCLFVWCICLLHLFVCLFVCLLHFFAFVYRAAQSWSEKRLLKFEVWFLKNMKFSGAGRDGDEIWQAEASTEATSLLIKKGKFFISSNNNQLKM